MVDSEHHSEPLHNLSNGSRVKAVKKGRRHRQKYIHQLLSRLKEGSQILYFAFWSLQYLLDDEFSLQGKVDLDRVKKLSKKIFQVLSFLQGGKYWNF